MGPGKISPVHVSMSEGVVIVQVLFKKPYQVLPLLLPCHMQKILSCSRHPDILVVQLLVFPPSLLIASLSHSWRGLVTPQLVVFCIFLSCGFL